VYADNLVSELRGDSVGEKFGSAVAVIDDIDGDHVKDFAVAAPENSEHGYHAGKISVYSGKKQKLLYVLYGEGAGDQLGTSIAAAGDVNGDGIPDFVAGAPQNDPHCSTVTGCPDIYPYSFVMDDAASYGSTIAYRTTRSGNLGDAVQRSLTFYNQYSGVNQTLSQNMSGTLVDTHTSDYYSRTYCITVNCTDTLKSNYGAILSRTNTWMSGYPVAGYAPGYVKVFSGINGSVLRRFQGDVSGDHFGIAVAGGDVNGDGYADVLVGADGVDTSLIRVGQAKVFSGRTGSVLYAYTGNKAGDLFGLSVAMLADINSDGYADFAVGAPRADVTAGVDAGAVYLYSGASGQQLRGLQGSSPMDRFGTSIAQQKNGKLLIGAPQSGVCWGDIIPCVHSGNQFTLTVDSSGIMTRTVGAAQSLSLVNERNGIVLGQSNAADRTTFTLGCPIGSFCRFWLVAFNGQYYDIVSNIIEYTPGRVIANTGLGYVDKYNATSGALIKRYNSSKKHDQFGEDVSSGDVDADGYDDIMVGSVTDDIGGAESGSAVVISGKDDSELSAFKGQAGDHKGSKVYAAKDLNGDGYDEMIVSSPETKKSAGTGKVEIYSAVAFVSSGGDSDGDGVDDAQDAFPDNAAAYADTDGDGMPDAWSPSNPYGCAAHASTCNGLTLDLDGDNDGVPNYLDPEALNPANSSLWPLNSSYKGSSVRERALLQ
jgi:hypothetical protein